MTSALRLSIIVPALNEREGIRRAIQSGLALEPLEVIVVDGGSSDGTADIARQERCKVLESARGRAVQQNVGARAASGNVLLFLHADTWLAPEARTQLAAALENQRVLGGAFRQRIEASGMGYRALEWGNSWRVRRRGMPYGDQGIFLRREVFEQLGGFPEVGLLEDVLLMGAFGRISRPVLLPGPLHVSARRWRRHGIMRQTIRNWTILAAHRLGVSPERLARYYRNAPVKHG